MPKSLKIIAFSFIWLLLFSQPALAVGVLVKPKTLDLAFKTGQTGTGEFLVINVAAEPALYQVSPDTLAGQIKFEPTEFTLDPNGSQIVKIKAKFNLPGQFKTDISIIALPMGAGGLAVGTGVKLPVVVIVSGLPWGNWSLGLGLGCLLLGFAILLILRVKTKAKTKYEKSG